MIKQLLKSRTVRVAIGQAVVGLIIAAQASSPEFKSVGWITFAKSLVDGYLRMLTTEPIETK